jgi:hypothetical protein
MLTTRIESLEKTVKEQSELNAKLSLQVNLSAPRPKGRGLLKVHPEPRFRPRLERGGFARSNG